MTKSCIVLLSGGLDSLLVVRLMTLQGLRVTALHSVNCFHGVQRIEEKKEKLQYAALALGAQEIVFPDMTEDVVALTKRPRHGYGKHLNACIDCRLRTVAAGFACLKEKGADFVVSGEVVGQRPMSQRRDAITLANREIAAWGFEGLLLRPLCAKLLEKTVPEREGWVDERYLYDISGRGRERQMALAEELELGAYPAPAGGCLLTDPGFSAKFAVLMRFKPDWDGADIELLKVGRHFQITPTTRIIASRREEENYQLRDLSTPEDVFFINAERNGAVVMLRGDVTDEARTMAAGLAVHYSKMRDEGSARVEMWRIVSGEDTIEREFEAVAVDPDVLRDTERRLAGTDCLKQMRNRKLV
jgi:Predicted tRNA(5-methylaminomethyl-2-thiouridylate) methyltransferase, contains the PP-loop ATPase domain